jgi:hypothetical protein
VEEEAKSSPCVWIARAGLEFGHHPRWALLRRGNSSAISLTFSSPPTAFEQKSVYSTRLPLTLHQSRRFFGCGLEGVVYQICLRRHHPKGVSAGAAGTQLLQKPALEAQGNPNLSFLVLPANKRPYPPRPIPFLKLLSLPSYHPKITRLHAPRIGPHESQKQNHFLESRFPVGRWRAIAGTYPSPSARLGYLS